MVTANFTICDPFEWCWLYMEKKKKKNNMTFGKKRGEKPHKLKYGFVILLIF